MLIRRVDLSSVSRKLVVCAVLCAISPLAHLAHAQGNATAQQPGASASADANRFGETILVTASPGDPGYPKLPPVTPRCSADDKSLRHLDFDWEPSGTLTRRIWRSGTYCITVAGVNDILYEYSLSLTEQAQASDDLSALSSAISGVVSLLSGKSQQPSTSPSPNSGQLQALIASPSSGCTLGMDSVADELAALKTAVAALQPVADSKGKLAIIGLQASLNQWSTVKAGFASFEKSVGEIIVELKQQQGTPSSDGEAQANCTGGNLAAAESIVLDGYVPIRAAYLSLATRASESDPNKHLAAFRRDLDSSTNYAGALQESYNGQSTSESMSVSLEGGIHQMVPSGGFLLTQLQARSYSSTTVPSTATASGTENVLTVDGTGKLRPALVALLNYNFPWEPWKFVGFGLSAGPVFDVANGKADTSKFGFFGGASVHLWDRFFLTPGIHVGEFADFPEGYSSTNNVIPANQGTPNPITRYTARFAFGVTYQIGSGTKNATQSISGQGDTTAQPSSAASGGSNPKPKS